MTNKTETVKLSALEHTFRHEDANGDEIQTLSVRLDSKLDDEDCDPSITLHDVDGEAYISIYPEMWAKIEPVISTFMKAQKGK